MVMLGNKIDLADSKPRAVSNETAKSYAESKKFPYFETSAKTDTNVQQAFEALTRIMLERPRPVSSAALKTPEKEKISHLSFKREKNSSTCCN
jgi:GTPase SAR1 family protein